MRKLYSYLLFCSEASRRILRAALKLLRLRRAPHKDRCCQHELENACREFALRLYNADVFNETH